MTSMQNRLEEKLELELTPSYLQVINESHNHSGAATESHFKLVVVSAGFEGLRLLQRHRVINGLFAEELNVIHALSMHTYTPAEWEKQSAAPASPKCGGSGG